MINQLWYIKRTGAPEDLDAGGVVLRYSGSRWLVALVKEKDGVDYILPKGKVEPGETLEMAARREIIEEAGLRGLQQIAYLGNLDRYNFPRTRWKKVHYFLYLSKESGGMPTDVNHEYQCKWFPLEDLPPMFWPEQAELIERVRRDLRQWLPQQPPPHGASPRSPRPAK